MNWFVNGHSSTHASLAVPCMQLLPATTGQHAAVIVETGSRPVGRCVRMLMQHTDPVLMLTCRCYECNEIGHLARDCLRRRRRWVGTVAACSLKSRLPLPLVLGISKLFMPTAGCAYLHLQGLATELSHVPERYSCQL